MPKQLYFSMFCLLMTLMEAREQPRPLDIGNFRALKRLMRGEIQKIELVGVDQKDENVEELESKIENRAEDPNLVRTKDDDRNFRTDGERAWDANCSTDCDSNCLKTCRQNKFENGYCIAVPKCTCQCI